MRICSTQHSAYPIGGCPAALRLALIATRSAFNFDQRAMTEAESRRAFAQAAMSRAVGATSAACIVMAAAIMAVLTESKVGDVKPPRPPRWPAPPPPPRPAAG